MKKALSFLFLLYTGCYICSNLGGQTYDYKQKITASDRDKFDRYGHSVAVYGKYAIVGSPWEKVSLNQPRPFGAAYIYKRDTFGKWNEIQKIVAPRRAAGNSFGWKVAIHGKYILISDPNDSSDEGWNNPKQYAGSAFIYEQGTNGLWSFKQKIVASDRDEFWKFGHAITINKEYIAVGAFQANGDPSRVASGMAYIFKQKPNGTWEETQKIKSSDEEKGDWFGFSISLSENRLAIGAPFEDEDASGSDSIMDAGSVYIYKLDAANKWVEEQKVAAPDRAKEDIFGMSLSIYGNYLAVAAPLEEDVDFNAFDSKGAVYMFKRNNSNIWTATQKVVSKDRSPKDLFGYDLYLYDSFLAVGAFTEDHDVNGTNFLSSSGSGYLFKLDQSEKWIQQQKFTAPIRETEDNFGFSVALYKDYLLFGAYWEDEDYAEKNTLQETGSVYIFENCPAGYSTIQDTTCVAYTSPSGKFTWSISGVYEDTISTVRGCDSFVTIHLTVQSQKTQDTLLLTACDSLISPSGKYVWKRTQTYFDTLPNRFGCDSILEIRLTVNESTYSNLYLSACDSLVSPSGRYHWKNSGMFMDTILNTAGCDSIISVRLKIIDKSNLKLRLSDTVACLNGNAITFSDTFQQIPKTKYQWTFGDGDTSTQNPVNKLFSAPGNYQIRCVITDSFCTDTFSAEVTIYENPNSVITNATKDTQCIDNNRYAFGATTSMGKAPYLHKWFIDGEANTPPFSYNYPKIDTVKLISEDQNGCRDTSLYIVNIDPCGLTIKTYNTFTPGLKDGKNDLFDIDVQYHDVYDLRIYNRYGTLVFESKDANIDWNGTLFNNGPENASGTYYYFLRYGTANVNKSVSGTILLIR